MKLLITESQLKRLVSEQVPGLTQAYDYQKPAAIKAAGNTAVKMLKDVDPHTVLQTAGLVSVFIPVIGPVITAGLAVADGALYYKQGKKKEATIAIVMGLLPGITSVATKIPAVKTLGQKGMTILADKIAKGITKYTALESEAIQEINLNKNMVHGEVDGLIKRITTNVGNNTVKKSVAPIVSKAASSADNYIYTNAVKHGANATYDALASK